MVLRFNTRHPNSRRGWDYITPIFTLNFIDSVFFEFYYKKNDMQTIKDTLYCTNLKDSVYGLTFTPDTSLLHQGYSLFYRIGAYDKYIIPQYTFKPDTGYYVATYNPVLSVNENSNN